MKNRWLIVLALVVAAVVSFVLQDVIYRVVFLPLAYLWWLVVLYYHAVPQLILWAALIIAVFVSSLQLIVAVNFLPGLEKKNITPSPGPVENLSILLAKPSRGVYYKWLVANRLGRLAREMLAQREGRRRKGYLRLEGKDWHPSPEVDLYLETGLNGSFADYPAARWWRRPEPTPLDIRPQNAVEFLEKEMEINRD